MARRMLDLLLLTLLLDLLLLDLRYPEGQLCPLFTEVLRPFLAWHEVLLLDLLLLDLRYPEGQLCPLFTEVLRPFLAWHEVLLLDLLLLDLCLVKFWIVLFFLAFRERDLYTTTPRELSIRSFFVRPPGVVARMPAHTSSL